MATTTNDQAAHLARRQEYLTGICDHASGYSIAESVFGIRDERTGSLVGYVLSTIITVIKLRDRACSIGSAVKVLAPPVTPDCRRVKEGAIVPGDGHRVEISSEDRLVIGNQP